MTNSKILKYTAALYLFSASFAIASDDLDELMKMPLKDLMKIEVTSVSKRAEKQKDAAAAIYVITNEDIRRSGMNNIPEVLRMVPGLQVSRVNSSWWAITSRGNAADFGNKLLVLIDGRSVYNPYFSGMLWEEQSTPLEDIERIEVIRGPGSTLWGANAVNGVINIITKDSADTQGNLVTAGAGNYDKANGLFRHGGKIGKDATFRTYVTHEEHDNSNDEIADSDVYDEWKMSRAGVRVDGKIEKDKKYSVISDVYTGKREMPFVNLPDAGVTGFADGREKHDLYGGNIIGKYSNQLDDGSDLDFQMYYDFVGRDAKISEHKIQTLDFDMQHSIDLNKDNQFIWGLGYRLIHGELESSTIARFDQRDTGVTTDLYSGFLQDKIQLVDDELFLTLGSKFEYNSFTEFEIQPNARLAWLPTDNQTVWASVSRSVRTPSIIDSSLTQAVAGSAVTPGLGFPGGYVAIQSNDQFKSEEMIAYELGYRIQPSESVSLDLTGFYNDYDRLRTFEQAAGGPDADIFVNLLADNKAQGKTTGFEAAMNWEVLDNWTLGGSYSYLDMDIKLDNNSTDTIGVSEDGRSPNNMFNIRSHYAFAPDWELDNAVYYVDSIDGSAADAHDVEGYVRMDAKLTYRPADGIETSLVGQNLLDKTHQEYGSATYSSPYEIPRTVYGKVSFSF